MTGAELFIIRRLIGLRQWELARELNVRRDSVRDYETGKMAIPKGVAWEVNQLADRHTAEVYDLTGLVERGEPIRVNRRDTWQVGVCMRVFDTHPEADVVWIDD